MAPVLAGIPLGFFALFFVYPLLAIGARTLMPGGELNLSSIGRILSDSYLRGVLGFTFGQALLSALATVLLGLPLGYILGRYRFFGRRLFMTLFTLPFMLPAVVVAVGFRSLLARGTLIGDAVPVAGTLGIILLAHVYYNLGLVIRITASFWSHLSPGYAEAAQALGASKFQILRWVYLPLLLPVMLGAFLLVFLFCFGSFGIILLLGGQGMSSIEVEIYRATVNLLDFRTAGGLALIQISATFALALIYRRFTRRFSVELDRVPVREAMVPLSRSRNRFVYFFVLAAALVFILAPLAEIAQRAFFQSGRFTWNYFSELFYNRSSSLFYTSPLAALRNSLTFASWTAVLAVGMGLMVIAALMHRRVVKTGKKSWLEQIPEAAAYLPLGTSAVTLGLGFMLSSLFRSSGWIGSPVSIIAMHAVIAFPFVVATLLPAYRSIEVSLLEAAAVLGAGVGSTFQRVVMPLLGRAVVVAICYAVLISLGEFGATLMLSRPETVTLPVSVNRLLSQPGTLNFGKAMAESTVLMVATALMVWIIDRFSQEGAD